MSFDAVVSRASRDRRSTGSLRSLIAPDAEPVPRRRRAARSLDGIRPAVTLADQRRVPSAARAAYGIADLAATPAGEEPRAGGALAFHVLDVMESLLESARTGRRVDVASRCPRPAPLRLQSLPSSD